MLLLPQDDSGDCSNRKGKALRLAGSRSQARKHLGEKAPQGDRIEEREKRVLSLEKV